MTDTALLPQGTIILKKYNCRGENITVTINSRGYFAAYHDDDFTQAVAHGSSLEQIEQQVDRIMRNHKRVRVEVRYTDPETFQPAVVVGRHARTREILVRKYNPSTKKWESDSFADYAYRYRSGRHGYSRPQGILIPDLPAKAIEQRLKLEGLKQKLDEKIQVWTEKYTFDLVAAVDKAIAEQRIPDDASQSRPND